VCQDSRCWVPYRHVSGTRSRWVVGCCTRQDTDTSIDPGRYADEGTQTDTDTDTCRMPSATGIDIDMDRDKVTPSTLGILALSKTGACRTQNKSEPLVRAS
jgi:hypothetical protein